MKILFVDDDEGLLDQAKYVLEDHNSDFDVVPFTSAGDALDHLKENQGDIIVSDYKMAGMDGLELYEELRDEGIDLPFIIFTGKGREEIAMEALNMGVDRYFKKGGEPISQYKVLSQAIEQEVEHREAKKESVTMEERLKEKENEFRAVIENSGLPMVVLEDGEIEMVNGKFEDLSGYSSEEVEGTKRWLQFVGEDDEDKVKRIHDLKDIEEGLATDSYRFKFQDKYGSERSVYASISVLKNREKRIISLLDLEGFEDPLADLYGVEEAIDLEDTDDIQKDISASVEEMFTKEGIKKMIKDWVLEEVLLLLIQRKDGSSGKELMSDLDDFFGLELSSSIVYPKLHDLEENGILWVKEHVRTKEYKIENQEKADELIEKKLVELFGIYRILKLLRSGNRD